MVMVESSEVERRWEVEEGVEEEEGKVREVIVPVKARIQSRYYWLVYAQVPLMVFYRGLRRVRTNMSPQPPHLPPPPQIPHLDKLIIPPRDQMFPVGGDAKRLYAGEVGGEDEGWFEGEVEGEIEVGGSGGGGSGGRSGGGGGWCTGGGEGSFDTVEVFFVGTGDEDEGGFRA